MDEPLWEQHAGWWQREFTDGADPEYEEQIIPLVERHLAGARRILDVGCGEGQIARKVATAGTLAVGVDPTAAQIVEARARGGGPLYARADADHLPHPDGAFDAVVMCLVIEHLDPFEPSIHEMARVLAPGGTFLLLMNHPLLQTTGSGWIDDHILEEQYWRVGPYLRDDTTTDEIAPGVNLPFMHRPLSRYVHVMGAVGLLIEDMDEPPPPPGFLSEAWEYGEASTIPRLMLLPRPSGDVTTTAEAPPSPPVTATQPEGAASNGLLALIRRPVVACLVLLCTYAGLSLVLNDPRGTLGTDTGGKLATLRIMEQRGTLDPDIGYWAGAADPDGTLHPLYYTFRVGDGWVNVTTLPMLYAAYPLYVAGGDRAILLLPMLGALLAALAARSLARRLGARSGWPAFWVIGLASPLAIYALDFWEHALGLGLMLWGVDWFVRAMRERGRVREWLIGGVLFGAAATMRTEALVYLAVCGGIACLVWLARERDLPGIIGRGLTVLAGAAVILVANDALERLVLGTSLRGARATGTAEAAGTSLGDRVHEAGTYVLGTNRLAWGSDLVLGAAIVLLVVTGIWLLLRAPERSLVLGVAALLGAAMLYLFVFDNGLGFVPGLLIASPFAAVGLALGWRHDVRAITVMAVVALPLVWFFQYSGGAGPQWGARYTLLSGALLLVAATVVLDGRRAAFVGALAVAVLITGFGIGWLSVRSTWVASGMQQIVDRQDQAVISGSQHLLREGGAFYDADAHWLTAAPGAQFDRAVRIVHDAGDTEFAYIVGHGTKVPDHIGAFERGRTQQVQFLRSDVTLDVVTYRAG